MTADEIQNLSGVELARHVAQTVMDWEVKHGQGSWYVAFSPRGMLSIDDEGGKPAFRPDRDWNHMGEVVDRMKELGFHFNITNTYGNYSCDFWKPMRRDESTGAICPTLCEAVCRAALLAVAGKETK